MADTKKTGFWRGVFNLISFIAIAMIGLALLLAYIFKSNSVSSSLTTIAQILAYIVVAFYAFFFAWGTTRRSNKSLAILLSIWVASVILIIVFVIVH